jgi:hypothetical protein
VKAFVDAAKKAGKIRPELDSAHLIITFLGATVFYFAYASTLKDMIRKEPLSPAGMRERKEQMRFTLQALLSSKP